MDALSNAIGRLEGVLDASDTRPRQIVSAARVLVQLMRAQRELGEPINRDCAPPRIVIPDYDDRYPPGTFEALEAKASTMTTPKPNNPPMPTFNPLAGVQAVDSSRRNGTQVGLNGDPDPLNLGPAGRYDHTPGGIRQPAQPGNPFGAH
jgi:hypothetical protein